MAQTNRRRRILVISQTRDLADIAEKAMEGAVDVEYAPNRLEALQRIRAFRPDIVILGRLDSPDSSELCRELRAGWISRHSSLLVVELNSEIGHCAIADEYEVGVGEYDYLAGSSGPLFPKELLLPRLKEKIASKLAGRENNLKASITGPEAFCLIWEQIPGLGAFERRQELVLENAATAAKGGKVCAISVTDNPGGNPAIATEILSGEIRKRGIEPLVHVAFRDRSRNQCESLLYQLAAMDINNLLVLTGDYPSTAGFQGTSRPVFDLDSVTGLQLIAEMNRGMEHEIMRKKTTLAPTDFFCGVAFSPFKRDEAEVMCQYYKLQKKIEAGADFVLTQVGYDVRKLHELRMWLRGHGYDIPVLISDYVLPMATARAMNANHVPGCVVTDKMLEQLAAESAASDKGRQARLDRAAKLYAIARGMGFCGVSVSGHELPYDGVEYIVGKGEELRPSWPDLVRDFDFPQDQGFYLFERDPKTGLNGDSPAATVQKPARNMRYYVSRAVHGTVFDPKSPVYRILKPLARRVDRSRTPKKALGSFEFWAKSILYGCQNCGDCALFDVAYLCPVSQCPKHQRNGACGGSHNGWCEVYEGERKCVWVRAYLSLKAGHKEDTIGTGIVPPCNWELWETSSWLNFYMGRDHVSKKLGIKPPP
ncbi:MAG: methylenetetrahydrofolate reductase C-terminal domain-containing protein [Dehalococcoidia bacterium]|nr:methylenetetrahydrofolate reductase C-terminal domain-containing protein [Dehalococcoidia bacterium]